MYYIQLDDGRNRLQNFQYLQTMKSLTRLEHLQHLQCCRSLEESCLPLHQLFTPFGCLFCEFLETSLYGVSYGIQPLDTPTLTVKPRIQQLSRRNQNQLLRFCAILLALENSTDFKDFKEQRGNEDDCLVASWLVLSTPDRAVLNIHDHKHAFLIFP